jgi:cellulose synthase/poly-beta-1,6-N-acetylglucosamine synthase-like glycosyltransferase
MSTGNAINIAVILPAYNEEQTIALTIEQFNSSIPEAAIWVINNRSSDDTERIACEKLRALGCAGGVISEKRPGKGNAVRRGFLEIDADIYILADADMTYPATRARDLMHQRRTNYRGHARLLGAVPQVWRKAGADLFAPRWHCVGARSGGKDLGSCGAAGAL